MGYVQENLIPGEKIVHRAKLHGIRYLRSVVWFFISFVLAIGSGGAGVIFFAIPIALAVLAKMDNKTSEFVLTNKRLYMKTGILKRNSIELRLSKIEGMQIEQSILGRMLDYGSITPGGTGGMKQTFRRIASPMEMRSALNQQLDQDTSSDAAVA